MVRHWRELLATRRGRAAPTLHRKRIVNGAGAIATALVFVIVLVTKFATGAWIVVIAAPILFLGDEGGLAPLRADRPTSSRPAAAGVALPARVHTVVLVSNLLAPTLRALAVRPGDAARRPCAR